MGSITIWSGDPAVEQGTLVARASFFDETGAAVTPNSGLTWSLLKRAGDPVADVIVNSRDAVAISPAGTITIVLTGDDLAVDVEESKIRYLLIEGTYNSTIGANLPIKGELRFSIADYVGVP